MTVREETSVNFSVTGLNVSSYQWYKSISSTSSGTAISGATNNTYTIPATNVTTALNNTYYYCVVTSSIDNKSTVTTPKAKLTVTSLKGGTTMYLAKGNTLMLTPTKGGGAGSLTWTTSTSTGLSLSATNGDKVLVTGLKGGTCTVTATESVAKASTTYTIYVTELNISDNTETILEDESKTLTKPTTGGNVGTITYSTTSSSITVDEKTGKITGIDAGVEKTMAIVTAKESNGNASCKYTVTVKVWNGEGTEGTPYEIASLRDFKKLEEKVQKTQEDSSYQYTNKYFKQISNLDLNSEQIMIGVEGNSTSEQCFNGIYDGNNKEIQNIKLDTNNIANTGLFTVLGENGKIKNVNTASGSVKASGNIDISLSAEHGVLVGRNYGTVDNCKNYVDAAYVGTEDVSGIVGTNYTEGIIKNCFNYATITLEDTSITVSNLGGIAGQNMGTVENCYNSGTITNYSEMTVGGIVGWNYPDNALIIGCINDGNIILSNTSGLKAGGIAGANASGSTIQNCTNYGFVKGNATVGGIVGWNIYGDETYRDDSTVSSCVNYGNVLMTGTPYTDWNVVGAGGIAGYVAEGTTIKNCYNKDAEIRGTNGIGGIAGDNYGTIYNSYNTGSTSINGSGTYLGGLAGVNQSTGNITNSYTQTDKTKNVIGKNNGKNTNVSFKNYSDMITESFVNLLNTENQWKMGATTPILIWQKDETYTVEIEEGVYMLYSALSPNSKVMDIADKGVEGANIQLYDAKYNDFQKFEITKIDDEYYKIISAKTGKSLDVYNSGTANNTNLQLATWKNTANQHWKFIDYKNGYYAIQSELGNYIHVQSGQTTNGTNILMWQDASSSNKNCLWMLKKAIR